MAETDPWDFSEFGERPAGQPTGPTTPTPGQSGRPDRDNPAGGTPAGHGFDAGLGELPGPAGPSTGSGITGSGVGGSGLAGFDTFGPAATSSGGTLSVARPPLPWLLGSAAAAVLGLLLAALLGALPPLAVIGWVLAGPVAIGALAIYTSADTRRRAQPLYVAPNWLTAGYYACLGVCLVGVIISAVRIALWVGRW